MTDLADNSSDKTAYEVIIIGGGHNGLVCATYLAQAGKKVLVLEANKHCGGAASTDEFSQGFLVSSCAQWLTQLSPDVESELSLKKHGLKKVAKNLSTIALDENGKHITIRDKQIDGEGLSSKDKIAYKIFYKQTLKFSKILAKLYHHRPPNMVANNLTDRLTLLKTALQMKLLGQHDMREFMRIITMNMHDFMEENFDNELLKAALALDGVMGTHTGPRSPNTVFSFLHSRVGNALGSKGPSLIKGGMGSVGEALAKSARDAGVTIRCDTKVKRILLEVDVACGVILENGETLFAKTMVSNADPKTTFKQLVGYQNIETGLVRSVHNIRMKGNAAKLHLALDGLPLFKGVDNKQLGNRLLIAPTMNNIEKAFNHAKYGEYSKIPVLDISIPTIKDKTLSPHGKHVLSAIVQFAPYQLKEGWTDETKSTFKQIIIDRIAVFAPDIKKLIINSELLTPVDIEQRFHLHGGHWHQGELSLDQILMMRPFSAASQYKTPIEGLYLCGAGSHPGGGVMGLAGRNAAKEIISRGQSDE